MDRRTFIKHTSLATAGGVLAPSLIGCRSTLLPGDTDFKGHVVIVGAGMAGLYAGYLLNQYNVSFEILEASSIHGGRLKKNDSFTDFSLDMGGEWLHGRRSIIGDLIKSTGTEIFFDKADGVYWHDGQIKDDPPSNVMYPLRNYESVEENISVKDYFYKNGGTDKEYDLMCELSGAYGASPEKLSLKWLNVEEEEYSSGSSDYKFVKTYYDFLNDHIAKGITNKIKYRTPIKHISYGGDKITLTDSNGTKYQADKVILALPITILKDGDIAFDPPLPEKKVKAFQNIGMEAGMKIFIKFKKRFYGEGIVGGSVCPAYMDESYQRTTNENIMLGFVMGDKAKHLSDIGEEKAIQEILGELDKIYENQATPNYDSHVIQDWLKEPYVRGAYSYSTLTMNGKTRSIAAEPVGDKLFFAGECMNTNGHHQTVHGAAETGEREVARILG